jgi:RNA polymerase sigma-70 factor (ECF subfamily)
LSKPDTYIELLLLQQIAAGDEKAFRSLINIYNPVLFPGINRIVKDPEVSQDILQETYLRLWLYRDKMPTIENPRAWILKIAYRRALTFLQVSKNQFKIKEEISRHISSSHVEIEKSLDFNTLNNLVKTAVSRLPPQQKKVYQFSRVEGYSQNEIAEMMGLAPQTVKNTMGRALQFIRDHITKSGYLLLNLSLLFY